MEVVGSYVAACIAFVVVTAAIVAEKHLRMSVEVVAGWFLVC
jgi:hypothetical protein